MSRATLKVIQAAAGNAGEAVYVDDVFSTYLYTGTNATQAITNGLDLAGEGGLVWTKARTSNPNEIDHQLMDSEQGAFRYILESNTINARWDYGASILTPNSDGFTLSSASRVNQNGDTYVSWSFRKQPGFFDVVTYTGTGGDHAGVDHGLENAPGMIVIKRTDSSQDWYVFHRSVGSSQMLKLNSSGAAVSNDGLQAVSGTMFHSDKFYPTSTANTSSATFVAYLFAHDAQDFGTDSDESIIKCGSYTGNGNSDGPTIDLGFEPQWIMWKRTDSGTESWHIRDVMRGMPVTASGKDLYADRSAAEGSTTNEGPIPTANGFKLVGTNTNGNASGGTYIYVAIRRPHKPPEAGTEVFMPVSASTSPYPTTVTSGFPIDMVIMGDLPTSWGYNWSIQDRLRGGKNVLFTSGHSAENTNGLTTLDSNTGLTNGWVSGGTTGLFQMFKRAPGFFDVVLWSGDGTSGRAITHNLGVVPEMIWLKNRTSSGGGANWIVATPTDAPNEGALNTDGGFIAYGNITAFSASTFTLLNGAEEINNASHNYIAYLFASVPGISKVGSYTGTGADLDIDCGFTTGARFVLVKRTDSTGDWYVWDSERGIVAGNDPYLFLNTTAAQVTNTDYIDPLSSGFTVTSSAPAALNASGGTYIFYAIA